MHLTLNTRSVTSPKVGLNAATCTLCVCVLWRQACVGDSGKMFGFPKINEEVVWLHINVSYQSLRQILQYYVSSTRSLVWEHRHGY